MSWNMECRKNRGTNRKNREFKYTLHCKNCSQRMEVTQKLSGCPACGSKSVLHIKL